MSYKEPKHIWQCDCCKKQEETIVRSTNNGFQTLGPKDVPHGWSELIFPSTSVLKNQHFCPRCTAFLLEIAGKGRIIESEM